MSIDNGKQWFVPKDDREERNVFLNVTIEFIDNTSKQLISDGLMWNLNLYINILLCGFIALFATLSNLVNMTVFSHLGLRDSMTFCLFALAFTDFLLSFLVVVSGMFYIWDTFFPSDAMDPMAINYVGFVWLADSLFICSGWITTYLAMERCVCVTFPFKVKQLFTRNRSIAVVITIYVIITGTYVPVYCSQGLEWVDILDWQSSNQTSVMRRLVVYFSPDRQKTEFYVEMMSATVLPIPSIIIILGSVIWMSYSLHISSKLRTSMTTVSKSDADGERQDSTIAFKTRRLVKVVIFLAIIFTICSIPRFNALYMGFFNPEVNEGGKERNLYFFQWQFARFTSILNAFVNIFVYLKINSSYRAKFRELLPCPKVLR